MINHAHFDLQSLRVFLLAAEHGSLTRAAEHAGMTLSALSKRIAELERVTDCALFIRLPRGLELTSAGQGLHQHARSILDGVNRMAVDVGDYAVGVRGHVKVWANTSAVLQFLPDDLAQFLKDNPQLRISLEEALSEAIIEAVGSGRADIGVFADNVPAPHLETFAYRHDQLAVLVPADHPLAGLPGVAFSDTLAYDYVALNQGSSLLRLISDAALRAGRVLNVRIQVSSFDGICRMIEAGLGIGVLPHAAVRPELLQPGPFGPGLRAVALTDDWARRTLLLGVKSVAGLQPEALRLFQALGAE
ncbi:DNA-binding transcriptional LysR family regulator [Pseudomonas sp. JUb42]|uniref:LysR family transcriptional regulator n=1 Tax=Pseudomonas sp. JUb42 TaxID=2940611 RepID=UPI0021695484|nr:LysR family transcriptional regulator [Pseudomonas sp. JUb42]MCS3472150.1 DNA-binding transcriptional LysR family regulator [Pseudomonas sp. JUb42]